MTRKLPTAVEMVPVLVEVLKMLGRECEVRELERMVSSKLLLTSEQLAVPHDRSRSEFQYRLGWARTYAKRDNKIVSPRRNTFKYVSSD